MLCSPKLFMSECVTPERFPKAVVSGAWLHFGVLVKILKATKYYKAFSLSAFRQIPWLIQSGLTKSAKQLGSPYLRNYLRVV